MRILCVLLCCLGRGDDTPVDLVTALQNAYEANTASLASGEIVFTYSSGYCQDLDSALKGRWDSRSVADGYLAFSGSSSRFEQVFPLDEVRRNIRPGEANRTFSPIMSTRMLTDGTRTLRDIFSLTRDTGRLVHRPLIVSGTGTFESLSRFPLGLGGTGLGYSGISTYIPKAIEKRGGVRIREVDDSATLDGAHVVKINFLTPMFEVCFWVDAARGSIPLKVEIRKKNALTITFAHSDLRLVDGATWLPYRQIVFIDKGLTQEIQIQKLSSANMPLKESLFALSFPEPVAVIDQSRRLVYEKRQDWGLSRLPSRRSAGALEIRNSVPATLAPDMPAERDSTRTWGSFAIVLGVFVVIASLAYILRQRGGLRAPFKRQS